MIDARGKATAMAANQALSKRTSARLHALAPWCLLVFALVILHLALMTGEHHSATTRAERAGGMVITALSADIAVQSDHGRSDHDTPRNTLDGCPVGQATLPLLLMLLGLVGFCFRRASSETATPPAASRRVPPFFPPPLPAAQRRALLQTFII